MNDLLTARLVLHPLSVGEAKRVAAAEPADDVLWAYGYPAEADMIGAWRYLSLCEISGDPRPFGAYEIRRRDDGYAVGGLGFHDAPDEHGGVTIGYGLVPAARGMGYATEALRELLRFARASGVRHVDGDTTHANLGSQRVMTAAGMRLVAEDANSKYYRVSWA